MRRALLAMALSGCLDLESDEMVVHCCVHSDGGCVPYEVTYQVVRGTEPFIDEGEVCEEGAPPQGE